MSKATSFSLLIVLPAALIVSSGLVFLTIKEQEKKSDNNSSDVIPSVDPIDISNFNFQFNTSYSVGNISYSQPIQESIEEQITYQLSLANVPTEAFDVQFLDDSQTVETMNFLTASEHTVKVIGLDSDVAIGTQEIEIQTNPIDLSVWFKGSKGNYPPDQVDFGSADLNYNDYLYTDEDEKLCLHSEDIKTAIELKMTEEIKWIVDNDDSIHITSDDLNAINYEFSNEFDITTPTEDVITNWGSISDSVIPSGYAWFKRYRVNDVNNHLFTMDTNKQYSVTFHDW